MVERKLLTLLCCYIIILTCGTNYKYLIRTQGW